MAKVTELKNPVFNGPARVPDAEIARRRAARQQPAPHCATGVPTKFARNGCSASGGAVLDRY